MKNKRLTALLKKISNSADKATSSQDILDAISLAVSYNGKIKFNNLLFWVLLAFSLLGLIFISFSYTRGLYHESDLQIMLLGVVMLTVVSIGFIWYRRNFINRISDKLYIKDMLFDNGMTELAKDAEMERTIKKSFKAELSRGNYTNEIKALYAASDYHCYHYHYVDKHTSTSTDSNGKTQTKTHYSHYDRYGFVTNLQHTQSIQILSDRRPNPKTKFKPAMIDFNKKFKIGAEDETCVARLLSPSVVLKIYSIAGYFDKMNIDIDDKGLACFSFKNKDVIGVNRTHGLENPEKFYNEIKKENKREKLGLLSELKTTIDRFTD